MQKLLVVSGMALLAAPMGAQTAHRLSAANSANPAKKAVSKPATLVKGHVTLPDGKAGAGARIYAVWSTGVGEPKFQRLTTNGSGDFETTLPKAEPGTHLVLTAFAPGRGLCSHSLVFGLKTTLPPLEFRLQPLISLSGSLIHSDGRPVANAALHVQTFVASVRPEINSSALRGEGNFRQGGGDAPAFLLPPEDLKTYFRARTDAKGRFTFAALPGSATVGIALDEGLTLAPGSAAPVLLQSGENKDVGVLVATRLGRARVRVMDRDGKPVANAPVEVMSADPALQSLRASRRMRIQEGQGAEAGQIPTEAQLTTNAQGEAETPGLFAGDYRLLVQGRPCPFRIEEGQTGKLVTLTLRQGPLKGRVLDASGKPAAHVPITLHATLQAGLKPSASVMATAANNAAEEMVAAAQNAEGGERNGNKRQAAIFTDAEGRFTMPNFPWGLESVTVSAERGSACAEWSGSPDKIGGELSLRLKSETLIPVCGRLLDAHRQPITSVTFKTLHWQNTPRIVWLMNARTAKADAEGRFQLTGLERGESFSLLTASLDSARSGKQAFESPRFVAQGAGTVQDLGDIIVHPAHDGDDDIATLYGLEGPPEILPDLAGALPNPSLGEVEEAKQALLRYRRALKTLDMDALGRSVSTASFGWSENKPSFLRNTALGAYAGAETPSELLPLRFVPRFALAALLPGALPQNSAGDETSDSAMRNAAQKLSRNQKWVFLTEKHGDTLTLAGILRKEAGEWRILNAPAGSAPEDLFLLDDRQASLPAAADFTRVAPAPDAAALEQARQIGEQYLRVWSQGRHAPMLTLTSPVSAFFTQDMAAFTRAFTKRPDGGLCPLVPEAPVRLQSMEGLTLWEQEWLSGLAHILASRATTGIQERRGVETSLAQFAKRGDLTVMRYTADERAFAMILARYDGKWQVLEPALPL